VPACSSLDACPSDLPIIYHCRYQKKGSNTGSGAGAGAGSDLFDGCKHVGSQAGSGHKSIAVCPILDPLHSSLSSVWNPWGFIFRSTRSLAQGHCLSWSIPFHVVSSSLILVLLLSKSGLCSFSFYRYPCRNGGGPRAIPVGKKQSRDDARSTHPCPIESVIITITGETDHHQTHAGIVLVTGGSVCRWPRDSAWKLAGIMEIA
jgi:hypothetical protein